MRATAILRLSIAITAGVLASAAGAVDEIVFLDAIVISITDNADDVVAADLNEDGITDLVIGGSDLEVLYGDGSGGFASVIVPSEGGVGAVAVADVYPNGHPDLIASAGDLLEVHVNLGAGMFVGPLYINIGGEADVVLTGDYDDDGDIDIAALDRGNDRVRVVYNAGDGLPSSMADVVSGSNLVDIASADLNNDGIPDLAATDFATDQITVAYAIAGGGFSAVTLGDVVEPGSLDSDDVDGDGDADLVVSSYEAQTAFALPNEDGQLGAPVEIPIEGGLGTNLLLGDLDGDGDPELIVINPDVRVLDNLGGFSFGAPSLFQASVEGRGVVADVSGDGNADLALLGGGLTVLIGDGDGGFHVSKQYVVQPQPDAPRAVDIDADGVDELVIGHSLSPSGGTQNDRVSTSTVGAGGIELIGWTAEPRLVDFDIADFNDDGLPDLVSVTSDYFMIARPGDGSGVFGAPLAFLPLSGDSDLPNVVAADMDLDGDTDIVAASHYGFQTLYLEVFENTGGTFGIPIFNEQDPESPRSLTAGDVDADGDPDIVMIAGGQPSDAIVYLNDGQGELTRDAAYPIGDAAGNLTLADLDLDGDLDMLAAACLSDEIIIRYNDGTGGFGESISIPTLTCPYDAVAADFNADGIPDLVAVFPDEYAVDVRLGTEEGVYCQHPLLGTGIKPMGALGMDVDLDGDDDLLIANDFSGTVTLALSIAIAGCTADFNGDGSLDILDFVAFQTAFVADDPAADCDGNGSLNILDFVCFQTAFGQGC